MSDVDSVVAAIDDVAPIAPPNTYYDAARKEYLFPRPDGSWLRLSMAQARRHLKAMGFDSRTGTGQSVSPLDAALNELELNCAVDYAGPLAGHRAGLYPMCGCQILVTQAPKLATPSQGEWDNIRHLFGSLFGVDSHQCNVFIAWLHIAIDSLYAGEPRPGQALALCGPKNCGKSLLQNLITLIMGGRVAKPYQFAFGLTQFNADLFPCEHLCIEDEQASTHMNIRRAFGTFVKGIAANEVHRLHAKNRDAITLQPHWRATISVNDEPENLMVLPPLDESMLDKITILQCRQPAMPFNDGSPAGRREYWERLVSEAPAFIFDLLRWEIPPELRCERYGVKAFQHPDLVEALLELSSERQLLTLIDLAQLTADGSDWQGTAVDLERVLRWDESTRRDADKLFSWKAAAGVFLGRLAQTNPDRVSRLPREHGGQRRWVIRPPADSSAVPIAVPYH